MKSLTGLGRKEPYQQLQRLLDMNNFIDYVLLNYYAGNQDGAKKRTGMQFAAVPPTHYSNISSGTANS
jgi:hypothetical protein